MQLPLFRAEAEPDESQVQGWVELHGMLLDAFHQVTDLLFCEMNSKHLPGYGVLLCLQVWQQV